MKKWIIISLSIIVFLFLAYRGIRNQFQGIEEEKKWYAGQLHFEFAGEIDSVKALNKKIGLLFFHVTKGADASQLELLEKALNEKLKKGTDFRFLLYKPKGYLGIVTRNHALYLKGDSIQINTDKDQILVYRNGKEISSSKVSAIINGRPMFRITSEPKN